MSEKLRSSGISVLGGLPWGTHICHFYESKEDLMEVLVPWFVEGLRGGELCVWVVSEPLSVQDAADAMKRAIPALAGYIEKGRLKILRHDEWYLENGSFNAERVLNGWTGLLSEATA